MTNNNLIVQGGVKVYNNRAFKSSPDYSIPNRFRVSINTTDVSYTDSSLTTTVPLSGTTSVDDCYVTTGWTISGGTISSNTASYKPDSSTAGSLNIIKSSTAQNYIDLYKTTTSVSAGGYDFLSWIYLSTTGYSALSTTAVEVRFGSDAGNYMTKSITSGSLTSGWNFLKYSITSGFTSTSGSPSLSGLDYTYFKFNTTTSQTWSSEDVLIDGIQVASSDDYYTSVDSISFDETDGSVSVVSKLTVAQANGFLIDGHALYNTDATEVMFNKSKFGSNSKDNTDLFKITNKFKLRNNNQ